MSEQRTLVVAAASQSVVEKCIASVALSGKVTLLTTKKYSLPIESSTLYLDAAMFDEALEIDFPEYDSIVLVQPNDRVVSYLNVYRFLQKYNVEQVNILTPDKPAISTSVSKLLSYFSLSDVESCQVIHIDPQLIHDCVSLPQICHGQILSGDWDLDCVPFDSHISFYESLKQRVEQNVPWEDTHYFSEVLSDIRSGQSRFGCSSESDLIRHCAAMDSLFQSISEEGWIQSKAVDYVTIHISRDGKMLFADGRHRLSIAKQLKLKSIPVKVSVRHAQWVNLKSEVKSYANAFCHGKLYAPVEHPDFVEFEQTQDSSRYTLIQRNILPTSTTVLDIGSHWGYLCGFLEKFGYDCTAVEGDVKNFYFLDKLRTANQKQFKAVRTSIFDFEQSKFDVVLALNIFHHFIKTPELHKMFVTFLGKLDINEMFLQTHSTDEPQMIGAYKNYKDEEFARFVIEHSCLNRFELISDMEHGRKLFHLVK
ncbi:methyltransferase domain-containing protein [Catenovulum sp. SX2]|uniref:methyltransferase domain-containing protein n=1 Tax=Catenovulum sp. SX2 TaxID=3398614 RepID=UPI003F85C431